MSDNLKFCLKKLSLIADVKDDKLRKILLRDVSCNNDIFQAIREIAVNTVNKNVPLSDSEKKLLRKYKRVLQQLALPSKTRFTKKKQTKLVVQSGGFLSILLPIVAGIIGKQIANS